MKWILALWVLAMLIPSLVQSATAAKEDYRAYFNKEYVAAGFTTPPSSVPGIWSIWAEEDLFGIRAVIMSNHPGAAFDPRIPKDEPFLMQLNKEFDVHLKRARSVKNESDYLKFIESYVDGFGDGHMLKCSY